MQTNTNVIRLQCNSLKDFFMYWVTLLRPYHKIVGKGCDLLAHLLYIRYKLAKVVKDDELLDSIIFQEVVKDLEELGLSKTHYYKLLKDLRDGGVIKNGFRIDPHLIPHLEEDSNSFNLVFTFDIHE